jgi:integrase
MRSAGDDSEAIRLRGLIFVLWRAGLRISEALALAESDLDSGRARFWFGMAYAEFGITRQGRQARARRGVTVGFDGARAPERGVTPTGFLVRRGTFLK